MQYAEEEQERRRARHEHIIRATVQFQYPDHNPKTKYDDLMWKSVCPGKHRTIPHEMEPSFARLIDHWLNEAIELGDTGEGEDEGEESDVDAQNKQEGD